MIRFRVSERQFAAAVARWLLGLMFGMAGAHKVFVMGPVTHARRLFVEPYVDSFLPGWSLWATGTVTPFVELVAGWLMFVGLGVRYAAFALGGVLVMVTFGHALAEPFFQFHTHVMPRTILLVVVLVLADEADPFALDRYVGRSTPSTA